MLVKMKSLILTSCLLLLLKGTSSQGDYFWRDYYGTIPFDAVVGGRTHDGQVSYIGQAVNPTSKNLLCGQIYNGDKHVTGEHFENYKSDYFVKILCTNSPNELKWIKTNITHLHTLTECNQIVCGYFNGVTLLIGRANYQGATYVGQVFDYEPKHWQAFYSSTNTAGIQLKEFEILAHNCNKTE